MSISLRKFIKIGVVPTALLAGNGFGLSGIKFAQTRRNLSAGSFLPEIYRDLLMRHQIEDFRKLIDSDLRPFAENYAATAVLSEV